MGFLHSLKHPVGISQILLQRLAMALVALSAGHLVLGVKGLTHLGGLWVAIHQCLKGVQGLVPNILNPINPNPQPQGNVVPQGNNAKPNVPQPANARPVPVNNPAPIQPQVLPPAYRDYRLDNQPATPQHLWQVQAQPVHHPQDNPHLMILMMEVYLHMDKILIGILIGIQGGKDKITLIGIYQGDINH